MTPTPRRRASRARWTVSALAAAIAVVSLAAPVHRAEATETGLEGIGPGAPLLINRSDGSFGCTANFVFRNGSTYYLGTAGHCLTSNTDGSHATRVRVCAENCVFGAFSNVVNHFLSPLVDLCGGGSAPACSFPVLRDNGSGDDFALIPIPSSAMASLRAEMPLFGGPNGTTRAQTGDAVCLYGNGIVAGETAATKGRPALVVTSANSRRWFAEGVATDGDSGAPVVDCANGAAVGVQNAIVCTTGTLVAPATVVCGTTIERAIALGRATLGSTFTLVNA